MAQVYLSGMQASMQDRRENKNGDAALDEGKYLIALAKEKLFERSEISKLHQLHHNIWACSTLKSCACVRFNLVLEYLT